MLLVFHMFLSLMSRIIRTSSVIQLCEEIFQGKMGSGVGVYVDIQMTKSRQIKVPARHNDVIY